MTDQNQDNFNSIPEKSMDAGNKAKEKKKPRVPAYLRRGVDLSPHKLDYKKYHYHWGIDRGNNLQALFDGGYEQVMDHGKPITRRGRNEQEFSYLLCIPMELYLEDQKGKLREPLEIEASMYGKSSLSGKLKGLDPEFTYGRIERSEQVGNSVVDGRTGKILKKS